MQAFEEDHPEFRVRVVAVASGEALELGRRGDVDVLLVHSPEAERTFVADGHGRERVPVMFNDFVLVGPAADPAGVRSARDASEALTAIARSGAAFISRGDDSGTHVKEREMWEEAGLEPSGDWYRESGQGQGNSLLVTSELSAYTLTDRATFLAMDEVLDLEVLHEGDPLLLNLYSVIQVTRSARAEGAALFASWLTSRAGREVIARFGAGSGRSFFEPFVVGEILPIARHGTVR